MPENAPIVLVPGNLPEGYCFTTWARLLNDFFTLSSGYVPGTYNFFVDGNTEPAPEDRGKIWIRRNGDGSLDRMYVYFMGQWLGEFDPVWTANSSKRTLWTGLEADLVTEDGGEAGPITATTGAFWEVDHNYDARFLVGPGTFTPDPADPTSGGTIAPGGTGGRENSRETLTSVNLPSHSHDIASEQSDEIGVSEAGRFQVGDGTLKWRTSNTSDKIGHTRVTGGDATGLTTPLNFTNLPPYRGIFVIRRTSRIFRRAIP